MTSRRLVVACAVAAATALLLGGVAVTIRWTADARWSEMAEWARAARADHARGDFRRPVAWGATHAGAAFTHYRRALELAQPLLADHDGLVRLWGQSMLPGANPGQAALPGTQSAIRLPWAPALAAMRYGAHCAEGGPAVDFDRPIVATNLLAARWLVNMTVLDACAALAESDSRRAVELLLDALAFGTDLLRSPLLVERMIGTSLVAIVVLQGCAEERLQLLDRAALDLLADGLARLDDDALATVSLAEQAMIAAVHALQAQPGDEHGAAPTWRFGFSVRWMMADAILFMAAQAQHPVAVGQPWPVRERLLVRQEREACGWLQTEFERHVARLLDRPEPAASGDAPAAEQPETAGQRNPWLGLAWPPLAQAEHGLRQVLAQLRCLRLAVDHHRGVAPAPLADPLGDGPFAVERTAAAVRFVSAGRLRGAPIERTAASR